jgi:hypothetical protein
MPKIAFGTQHTISKIMVLVGFVDNSPEIASPPPSSSRWDAGHAVLPRSGFSA